MTLINEYVYSPIQQTNITRQATLSHTYTLNPYTHARTHTLTHLLKTIKH